MKKKIIFLITVFVFGGILFSREMIIKADTKKREKSKYNRKSFVIAICQK